MPRSPAQKITTAERQARVIELRRKGTSFEEIGADLGVTRQRAHKIYETALKAIPGMEVAQYRAEQAERLDDLLREAYAVLGRDHLTVSHGHVVRIGEPELDDEGEPVIREGAGAPVLDDGPKLQAVRTILAIEERRARLLGLDAPVKAEVGGNVQVRYEVVGVDLEALT